MVSLFYAAGHHNYARDGLYYLKSMQNLPEKDRNHFLRGDRNRFLRGERTVQDKPDVFNGIWIGMAIETS